jgi:hypothetical protein
VGLAATLAQPAAAQQDEQQETAPHAESPADPAVAFALGVSLGFLRQQGLGTQPQTEFIPSLLGLAYVPIAPRLFLRPGVRLGYVGLSQPPSSYGARIEEYGVQGTAELGLSYDAWLVPALALGGGINYRSIDFVGRGIVLDSDVLDHSEWLGLFYVQAGLGLPLFRGALVIEPYARLQHTVYDDRSLLQLGVDLSFSL